MKKIIIAALLAAFCHAAAAEESDVVPYPEANAAELHQLAALMRADPPETGPDYFEQLYRNEHGRDIRYREPYIYVNDFTRARSGVMTEEVRERTTYPAAFYDELFTCTYPKGGLAVQFEEGNIKNYVVTGTIIGSEEICESTSWRIHNKPDLGGRDISRRFDSWAAIHNHWRALNDAALDGASSSAEWLKDLFSHNPLFTVPLLAAGVWFGRRLYLKRKAK